VTSIRIRARARAVVPLAVLAVSTVGLVGCGGSSSTGTVAATTPSSAATTPAAAKPVATCPLTGVPPHKGQDIKRVPLAVKIDNVAPALPQAGVNDADIVFEELVEGGLTRLMAVFQCNSTSSVGPIRSARTTDADVLALFHGSVFGFSGANPEALPPIEANGDTVLVSYEQLYSVFHRDLSRPAPHNVFASTSAMLKAGLAKRKNLTAPKPLFSYGAIDPRAKKARTFALSWPASSASWTWSGGQWLRVQNGVPDRVVGGQQISAANVVVLSVTIGSSGLHDVLGNPSPLDVTTGSNPVWVFRNGKVVKGTWSRPKVTDPLTLKDKAGTPIDLSPGRTWVELLPTSSHPPTIG
jgi:hypothetical protein